MNTGNAPDDLHVKAAAPISLYGAFELTQRTPMKKTIWSCWFQGRDAAPHLGLFSGTLILRIGAKYWSE
jgi:hypothetical protein